MITIYKYNTDQIRAIVSPDENSEESKGIMAEHIFKLSFSSSGYYDFQIGDYAIIFDTLFRLNKDAEFDKTAKRNYQWTLTMEGPTYELRRAQYLSLNAFNNFTQGKFILRNTPYGFMQLIIDNMNRALPGLGWEMGTVLDADFKTIDFDGFNCLRALNTLAEQFDTEYIIEDRKIHLVRRELNSGLTLEYGKKKPLYGLGRKNQDSNDPITRLYAYGSTRNLGTTYRNGAPRLRMADSLYVEKNVNQIGLYESTIVFDGSNNLPEIYPHRTGTISSVTTPLKFSDATIDFDVNEYLIPGVRAKITFNTGFLAGIEFELSSFDFASKTFTIKQNTDDQTMIRPNDDFKAIVGDQYVLTDITQPIEYVNKAEQELKDAAIKYLNENGSNKLTYPVTCNPFYFKANPGQIKIGYMVQLLDTDSGIDRSIRIKSYTRNFLTPELYKLELSDTVKAQPIIII